MSLKTLFAQNKTLEDIRQKLQEAMRANDPEQTSEAFSDLFQYYAETTCREYEELRQEKDAQVLAARGVRQLTAKEREYYQKLGEAMNSADSQAINNLDLVMPETVFDDIFKDLVTEHPILGVIQFMNTGGAVRMLMNTNGYQRAAWGKLCATIIQELSSAWGVCTQV